MRNAFPNSANSYIIQIKAKEALVSKSNQPGPSYSPTASNGVTPIVDAEKPARINLANPKNRRTNTEHSLKCSDVEVYGLAGLKLLQQRQFADAFNLLAKGRHHLTVNCLATPEDLEADFVLLEKKLVQITNFHEPVLPTELSLVSACLLHPLESFQCFAAFSALADSYVKENEHVIADQLAFDFLNTMSRSEY